MKLIYGLSKEDGRICFIGLSDTEDFKSYGYIAEILEIVEEEEAQDRLVWWRDHARSLGYELLKRPSSRKGAKLSEETKQKIAAKAKGHKRNAGKRHSEETRYKMSFARHRKFHTEKSIVKDDCPHC